MKKVILVMFSLMVSTAVLAQEKSKIKGDKDVITKNNTIEKGFYKVEIDDKLKVSMRQSDANSYMLTTDRNLHEVINFVVKDSVLVISTTNRITRSKKLEISLNFINLERITLKNGAEIKGEGEFSSKLMNIDCYNSSKFELDIKADEVSVGMFQKSEGKLKVQATSTNIVLSDKTELEASVVSDTMSAKLINSAELNLKGDIQKATFNLKESTDLKAHEMKVSNVEIYTSDKVRASIYAGKKLTLYADGKSKIEIYGQPQIEIKGFKDTAKLSKK